MYSWRRGWRADVLRIRGGDVLTPPLEPVGDEDGGGGGGGDDDDGADAARCCTAAGDEASAATDAHAAAAWDWWRSTLGSPRYVAAPMVR